MGLDLTRVTLDDIVTRELITVPAQATLVQASALLARHHLSALVVLDQERPCGMLALST